jgi:hypothetical protein
VFLPDVNLDLSASGSSNLQVYLKRHFANPGRIAFNADGSKMFVSSYEGLLGTTASSGSSDTVNLGGRIMVFDTSAISGQTPTCTSATFDTGGCDVSLDANGAPFIIGQGDSGTLPVYGSHYNAPLGSDYVANFSYGIPYIADFMLFGNQLVATVPDDSNSIYMWNDIYSNGSLGKPHDQKVVAPTIGSLNPTTGQSMPVLNTISSIVYSPTAGNIYVVDSNSGASGLINGGLIYQIKAYSY